MKRDVGWETANMEGQTRTCSEINEPGGTGGERSVEELGCCGLTSLQCDEMRKHDGVTRQPKGGSTGLMKWLQFDEGKGKEEDDASELKQD
jgi:hypothetical protein